MKIQLSDQPVRSRRISRRMGADGEAPGFPCLPFTAGVFGRWPVGILGATVFVGGLVRGRLWWPSGGWGWLIAGLLCIFYGCWCILHAWQPDDEQLADTISEAANQFGEAIVNSIDVHH
jgi:hypothetical protein